MDKHFGKATNINVVIWKCENVEILASYPAEQIVQISIDYLLMVGNKEMLIL
jgi:hypothetical protein